MGLPVHGEFFENPSLTLALAMAAGIVAQAVARHINLPGIVLLLAVGVILGPDALDMVRPASMGAALQALVGFAVAIILFEGGLHLRISHLRSQAKPIRRLVTVGALVTTLGGMAAAYFIMGWEWRLALLFGTLVIVTGPTVITPLLRRIRVQRGVSTILEAEGVFIDAVGATIAVVALEVVLEPSGVSIGLALPHVLLRIGGGALIGLVGGAILALLLRWRNVVPHGLSNILVLAFAVAIFQISNSVPSLHESGITAAIVAGFVVGNTRSHAFADLVEFKEQLTVLLIATLFVLLAADVRIADVVALGWRGVATVLALMFLVRPLTVAASTARTDITLRQAAFLSWLAPRGIVAAAVASLFALNLDAQGVAGGTEMRALVFLVIALTVTLQGLTGGWVASFLKVRRASNLGYLVLGANRLSLMVAKILKDAGEQIQFIDGNAESCHLAEEAGFKVIYGNGLAERTLARAQADARSVCIGFTPNESVNMLFARTVHDDFYGPQLYVALETSQSGVTEKMATEQGFRTLFAGEVHLQYWDKILTKDRVGTETWMLEVPADAPKLHGGGGHNFLPLVWCRGKVRALVHLGITPRKGDCLICAVNLDARDKAHKWLRENGFVPAPDSSAGVAAPNSGDQAAGSAASAAPSKVAAQPAPRTDPQ